MSILGWRLVDSDGNEVDIDSVEVVHSWSMGVGFDENGNIWATENGEPADDLRAVELYASFGGAVGWRIMDAIDPRTSDTPPGYVLE